MFEISPLHILETEARRLWFSTKRALRIRGSSDKNFLAADAALRLARGDLARGTKITTAGRRDGIGMQALSCLSAIAFARALEAEYVHTPFGVIDHTPEGQEGWARRWEEFLGFERLFRPASSFTLVDYGTWLSEQVPLGADTALRFQQCWWFTRRYPDAFLAVAPELRANLRLRPRTSEALRVALHVRRGDVSKSRNNLRYTDEAAILASLASVKEAIGAIGREVEVTVFSQGSPRDFQAFEAEGCRLELDTDALETMKGMIEADVLIMAKSSFSYVAALLSGGTVVYEPTFNPPLSTWLSKDAGGRIEPKALVSALERQTKAAASGQRAAAAG